MFGETFTEIPIVEVSMNASLDPEDEWALGAAIAELRDEGLLVLSGGLTIHNIRAYIPSDGDQGGDGLYRAFDRACLDAVTVADVSP
jgi:aromatic ring-opening dioxygenase catalytic subunit (LigB family)